jgi:hypothetical protein
MLLAVFVAGAGMVFGGQVRHSQEQRNASHRVTLTPEEAEIQSATSVAVTGKLVFHVAITVASNYPEANQIICDASNNVSDQNLGDPLAGFVASSDEAVAFANYTKGQSLATCTVMIPYAWTLPDAASNYVASSIVTVILNAVSGGIGGQVSTRTLRTSAYYFPDIHIPASGSTTTRSANLTL